MGLVALCLGLVTPASGGEDSEAVKAARLVARMFPTAGVSQNLNPHHPLVITPIKRKGKWGYGHKAVRVAVPGGYLLAFELELADIEEAGVDAFIRAEEMGVPPEKASRVLAVVLVNRKGKFVAKAEGFPLEADILRWCMGDLCIGQGVALGALEPIPGAKHAALLRYTQEGVSYVRVLFVKDGVHASSSISLGSMDDLSGCGLRVELIKVKYLGGPFEAELRHHCNKEACPEECAELPKAIEHRPFVFGK